ncbi:MAG: ABC transporter permease [Chloroflexota bacterium]
MRSLFGLSQDALVLAVGVAVVLMFLALGAQAWRQPLFARLALRRAFRRPGLAVLITAGLTVSTIVLSSAFTTGDTVSLSVRSVVAGVVGTSDEIVFLPKRQRRSGAELAQALASGTFLTGWNEYCPETEYSRVLEIVADDPRVSAVIPAVLEQVAVSTPELGLRGQVAIVGLPAEAVRQTGGLRTPDGRVVDLDALAADEILINSEGAAGLGVASGDMLRFYGLAQEVDLRLAMVTRSGDLGGAQATLFLPLGRLQQIAGRPGELNQILVANRGNAAERIRASWPVTVALRAALLDDAASDRLFQALAQGPVRDALARESIRGPGSGRAQEKLNSLVRSLQADQPTPEFDALVQDPELLGRVASSLNVSPGALEQSPLFGGGGGRRLRVLDVQQMAQDQADRWASAFTSLFVALGLFSLSTGVLLVVLVFSLLALERRGELGTIRALGGRRGDVISMLVFEGVVHSALAAAVGLVLGVGLALAMLALAGNLLSQYGFRLEPAIEPASLLVSAGLGFLLTTSTVAYGSWRASRFSIVAAIRDLPDPQHGWGGWPALLLGVGTLGLGCVLWWLGLNRGWSIAYVAGSALGVLSLAQVMGVGLRRVHQPRAERTIWTLAGGALVLFGCVPPDRLRTLGMPVPPSSVDLSVWSGLTALLGCVWLVAMHAGLARLVARRFISLRLSVAELAEHRFRTGMTLAMFSLVVLSLTVAGVLLTVTHVAFGDPEVTSGGWHLRGEKDGPPLDVQASMTGGPLAFDTFSGFGTTATISAQAIVTGGADARWGAASVLAVDAPFTASVSSQVNGAASAPRELWRQLSDTPGTAIVGAGFLTSSGNDLRISVPEGSPFRPFTVWIRDTRSTQAAIQLEVIGIADGRGPYNRSVLVGQQSLAAWPIPERFTYLFSISDPVIARDVALGINLALPELNAQVIGDDLRLMQGVRGLLTMVLQGYMAIGLISGLAALAVISTRAVVERRRQIGTLRALGASARGVTTMLLLESGLVAVAGALLGIGVGLTVAHQIVMILVRQTPELRFTIPWEQLSLLVLIVLVTGLLTTIVPARQAGRLSPAEALREA